MRLVHTPSLGRALCRPGPNKLSRGYLQSSFWEAGRGSRPIVHKAARPRSHPAAFVPVSRTLNPGWLQLKHQNSSITAPIATTITSSFSTSAKMSSDLFVELSTPVTGPYKQPIGL